MPITIEDLYAAYRKAKVEAFYDGNVSHGAKFAAYEERLLPNLRWLHASLRRQRPRWLRQPEKLGRVLAIPKEPPSEQPEVEPRWHFFDSDRLHDWQLRSGSGPMGFRKVMDPSVALLVLSALWIIKVGVHLDSSLSNRNVYGNRVDRYGQDADLVSHQLFKNWSSQYQLWQRGGNSAIREALAHGEDVIVINMDLRSYYHSIDPSFVIDRVADLAADDDQEDRLRLTSQLLTALRTWQAMIASDVGLPVGLPASNVIANILLQPLDEKIAAAVDKFYGRYVDDMFLVFTRPDNVSEGAAALDWLSEKVDLIRFDEDADGDSGLVLDLEEHERLPFSREKTTILRLQGESGLDMLAAVDEALKARTSEQRLKPPLPLDPVELGRRALILLDERHQEIDELRRAHGTSLRRAAFSQILRLMEQYERDLDATEWKSIREQFYGLVLRQVITPDGLYVYFRRLSWLFALMVSCADFQTAREFLARLSLVRVLTSGANSNDGQRFWENLDEQFTVAAAGAVGPDSSPGEVEQLISEVRQLLCPWLPRRAIDVARLSTDLFRADWGRSSYAASWATATVPPAGQTSRAVVREHITEFRMLTGRRPFDWRPMAFPTRPLPVFFIGALLPDAQLPRLNEFVVAFRGYPIGGLDIEYEAKTHAEPACLQVGPIDRMARMNRDTAKVAVTSFRVTHMEWEDSLIRPGTGTLRRYQRIRKLVSDALSHGTEVDYFVLPELSLPRRWMRGFSEQLAGAGISLVAGVEYHKVGSRVWNQCLVSLSARAHNKWVIGDPVVRLINKTSAARYEGSLLKKHKLVFQNRPGDVLLFHHHDFVFATLICSDLTNVRMRAQLTGRIDALIVPEWNPDLDGFASIVQASATDLHAFIVQVNNRLYGDSWIRGPYCERFRRDIVRLKGGSHDYVVVGSFNYEQLRAFQADPADTCDEQADKTTPAFKPLPIGFNISRRRSPW